MGYWDKYEQEVKKEGTSGFLKLTFGDRYRFALLGGRRGIDMKKRTQHWLGSEYADCTKASEGWCEFCTNGIQRKVSWHVPVFLLDEDERPILVEISNAALQRLFGVCAEYDADEHRPASEKPSRDKCSLIVKVEKDSKGKRELKFSVSVPLTKKQSDMLDTVELPSSWLPGGDETSEKHGPLDDMLYQLAGAKTEKEAMVVQKKAAKALDEAAMARFEQAYDIHIGVMNSAEDVPY